MKTQSTQRNSSRKTKGAVSSRSITTKFEGDALASINEKLNSVKKFKAKGERILEEARDLVEDATLSLPTGAMDSMKKTEKQIRTKMQSRPVLSTVAVAAVGALGAGYVVSRYLNGGKKSSR